MPQFRKKPAEITAKRQWRTFQVETLEGTMAGKRGDWLITGVNGEQYPCDHEIFCKTYEALDKEGDVLMRMPTPNREPVSVANGEALSFVTFSVVDNPVNSDCKVKESSNG